MTATPIHAHADAAVSAEVRVVDGRRRGVVPHRGWEASRRDRRERQRDRRASGARSPDELQIPLSVSSTRRAPSCATASRRCTRGDGSRASWYSVSGVGADAARGDRRLRFRAGPRPRAVRPRGDDRRRVRVRHRARLGRRFHRRARVPHGARRRRRARARTRRRDARRRATRPTRATRSPHLLWYLPDHSPRRPDSLRHRRPDRPRLRDRRRRRARAIDRVVRRARRRRRRSWTPTPSSRCVPAMRRTS